MSPAADLEVEVVEMAEVDDPSAARARQVAAARAAHPSMSSAGSLRADRHLAVVRPIRPPTAPEAWSAGLWGSFA